MSESMEAVRTLARSQHGLVSTRQLSHLGVSKALWQRRLQAGDFDRVTRQVLRMDGVPATPEQKAMIAVLDGPDGSHLSHLSAAALWGLPGFRLDTDLHVVVPQRGQPRRVRNATIHYQVDLPHDQLVRFRSVPVTSPLLTMFHLAAVCHPGRVARAFDRAWNDGLLSGTEAERLLERLARRGRNGITTMRAILDARGSDYVPPASNLEGRFAELFHPATGVPPLRRQVDIGGENWIGRVDFVWDDVPGGVEVQSERFHTSLIDKESDGRRMRALEEAGLSMIAVWDSDVFHRPFEVVDRVRRFRWWLDGVIAERPI